MLNTPFAPWPSFTDEEADAVRHVIMSNRVNYWTGNECREFEREFAAWSGTRYSVALANGTLALDVALHALGIGQGDEVVVTPRGRTPEQANAALLEKKIIGGLPLGRFFPELKDSLLLCATEMARRSDIDAVREVLL